ncbi:MAG: aminopeptidase P family protein [Bacteroidales bacterium]|jgi:Xaa-Pro aminopeptidase|nr:aminopeptidase P family protein [Bacteroidales bacterium]
MFDKSTYIHRRKALQSKIKDGVLLFLGNNEASMNYPANTYRYRQDSQFVYFFGIQLARLAAIIDIDAQKEIIFGDDYTIDDIIWMGNQPTIKALAEKCGVSETRPLATLVDYLQKIKAAGRTIHFLPPYRDDNKIFLHNTLGIPFNQLKSSASVEFIKGVVALQEIKEEKEIVEIEKACNVGVNMHLAAMRHCKVGMLERELAGLVEGIALSGGNGVSFPVILSQNGETLHNHNHEQILEKGRMLLVDAGAELKSCYSSDYTRTYPVSGKFSQQQREIYEIVLQANMEAIAMAKPGIRYFDVHLHASTVIAKGLTNLGLMKGDPVAAAKEGAHALFMPHGLGHMLGIDVHDMEGLGENYVGYDEETQRSKIFGHGSLRCGKKLKKGFVLTVEPGIYFIPQLIDIWEKEKKFIQYINYEKVRKYVGFGGIRIEDDILITDNACRVLGNPLPKQVEEIEKIMAE